MKMPLTTPSFLYSAAAAGLLTISTAQALEVRIANGDFDLDGAINPVMEAGFSLPTTTISLAEPHYSIGGSRFFAGFNLDYFSSDTLNRLTDFASTPLTTPIPGFGGSVSDQVATYTRVPVPADYRIHGTNVDLHLGYDLLHTPQGTVSAGINTGISMPFMETRNLQDDANVILELMDSFDTRIRSYKLGPVVTAEWHGVNGLSISGKWIFNLQTGSVDNDLIEGKFDIDGSYHSITLALHYFPGRQFHKPWLPRNSFVTAGWQRDAWDFDKASVTVQGFTATTPTDLDLSFSHQRLYIGAGVTF